MIGKITLGTKAFPSEGEVLLFFTFENTLKTNKNLKLLDEKLQGKIGTKINKFHFEAKDEQVLSWEIDGFYQHIFLVGLGKKADFKLVKFKNILASAVRRTKSIKAKSINLFYFDELGDNYFEIGKNLALGFYLANYSFSKYKSEEEKKKIHEVEELNFYLNRELGRGKIIEGIEFGKLISEGIYLTRDLVNEPASYTHPDTLKQVAFQIEKESKGRIKVEVFDEDECQRLGMGAFLGVAQGSERKPKLIILKYQKRPTFNIKHSTLKTICLIGKSITFDSGGLSLKPSEAMEMMKIDMAGGATVLGIFKILGSLGPAFVEAMAGKEIYGILPACENMPSGKALRPGDVLTAMNGKTIEVLNTDAEGRLTLADALVYAEKNLKADIIIDLATLTGACQVALGNDLTGFFGNDEKFMDQFKKIAENEGDELWPLPLYKDYLKKIKSDVADLKNIGRGRYGGAITAALFLSEFVKKAHWIHLDIAGTAFNNEVTKGVIEKGGTGWGVTSIINYIYNLK